MKQAWSPDRVLATQHTRTVLAHMLVPFTTRPPVCIKACLLTVLCMLLAHWQYTDWVSVAATLLHTRSALQLHSKG
jgi:hypothetical protein